MFNQRARAILDQMDAADRDGDHQAAMQEFIRLDDEVGIVSYMPESLRGVTFDLLAAWRKVFGHVE